MLRHSISEVVDCRLSEPTLVNGERHPIVCQPLEDVVEDLVMLSLVLSEAQNIIQVDETIGNILESMFKQLLPGTWT